MSQISIFNAWRQENLTVEKKMGRHFYKKSFTRTYLDIILYQVPYGILDVQLIWHNVFCFAARLFYDRRISVGVRLGLTELGRSD
jgi:hypothetical protein